MKKKIMSSLVKSNSLIISINIFKPNKSILNLLNN